MRSFPTVLDSCAVVGGYGIFVRGFLRESKSIGVGLKDCSLTQLLTCFLCSLYALGICSLSFLLWLPAAMTSLPSLTLSLNHKPK